MSGAGLYELIQAARERYLTGGELARYFDPIEQRLLLGEASLTLVTWRMADEVLRTAAQNPLTDLSLDKFFFTDYSVESWLVVEYAGEVLRCPLWKSFWDVCELAARVDDFLAVVGSGSKAFLPRDCRRDLGLLPVLADWCEDHDLPAGAAEARHLDGLIRSLGLAWARG